MITKSNCEFLGNPVLGSHEEYAERSCEPSHAHKYLWPKVVRNLASRPLDILDLGCGNGAFSEHLASLGHKVTGIDISEMGIELARKRQTQADFLQQNIYDNLSENFVSSFDVVVSLEVIEHLYHPRILIRQALSALKTGGILILSTPYHGYMKNLVISLFGRMDRHHSPLWDHGHIKFFSRSTLATLVESEGFRIMRWRFAGRVPLLWKSMIVFARPL